MLTTLGRLSMDFKQGLHRKSSALCTRKHLRICTNIIRTIMPILYWCIAAPWTEINISIVLWDIRWGAVLNQWS